MIEAHLTSAPAGDPIDLRHLDATLANLRRAERAIATMAAYLVEARDCFAAAPNDLEAARRVIMTELRMRADAVDLALQFAALATPIGAAP
ncbi:MAG: hypothetical protein ACRYGP_01975 [Janthinobacterium lividum]